MGFGFRGSSPPWPYVGIGRGGLPRCGYFFSGRQGATGVPPYQQTAYQPRSGFAAETFYPSNPEQELDYLKNQAGAIGKQLEDIGTRIRDLQKEK
jgi:hypothetical protein